MASVANRESITAQEPLLQPWADGDFPVRAGCAVEPLIDGRAAMFAMCQAFLAAKRFILLAGWDISVELPMVRGDDTRLGADDSASQQALVASLRAVGLDDDAIALWTSGRLRVVDVLGFAAARGVRVGVLLWDAYHLGSHLTNDPTRQREQLAAAGVDCLLDDSSRHVAHMTQALHQKCAVVDGSVAFVGGIDLTVQEGGDYDRWDMHTHPCACAERVEDRAPATHPWHDVHARIQGPAVADVLANIVQRWTEVAARHHAPDWPAALTADAPSPAVADGVSAQIVRTIPPRTYAFAPDGIATIKATYVRAFERAQRFIYIENQYLWPEVFLGLDSLRWGERSPDAMEVLLALAGALARGVRVGLTLPDHPNCGRRFSDGGVAWLRARAAEAGMADRLHVFTLGSAEEGPGEPGGIYYRPIYTHAKVAIVDDAWWTVGSANLNSRGMRSDAEINLSVADPVSARALRLRLWNEHLRRAFRHEHGFDDAAVGLAHMRALADANRERVRRRHPLAGHLLPYLTAEDGATLDLPVHPEHGWLDNLPGGAGARPAHHAGKYL